MKNYFRILLFFSLLGNTEGWSNVAPRESLTVCRAGGGLWAEGSYRLDFFGSFCVKTKRTRENVDLSWSPKSTNRYLREGKEYVSDFDWNKYDFTGRTFDSWTLRALQVDPMATKYYSTSPYALWVNNPLRVIDPTGMWSEDGNGFTDILKQIAAFFGIGKKPENDEQAREYAERRESLQNYNKDMEARVEKAQEVADYIPFVGAALTVSEGAVKHDDATLATGLGMFVLDITGGKLLKEAGKAAIKSVAKGGRVFWSGGGNEAVEAAAREFATNNGMTTLEMTKAGENLTNLTQGMSWAEKGPMWQRLSTQFAKGANGTVHVFQNAGGINVNSVWGKVEYPILKQNGVNIIYHIVP